MSGPVTLARARSLSRIGSEERSPTLVELSRQRGQSVKMKRRGLKKHQKTKPSIDTEKKTNRSLLFPKL